MAEPHARDGACVAIAEIAAADGEALARAIAEAGGTATFIRCDVSKAEEVKAAVEGTVRHFGGVDVLVNNAAVQMHGQDARAHELSDEVWDRTLGINLRSVWLFSRHVIPTMVRRGGSSIIHVASPTG